MGAPKSPSTAKRMSMFFRGKEKKIHAGPNNKGDGGEREVNEAYRDGFDAESLKKIGMYRPQSAQINVKRTAIAKLSQNHFNDKKSASAGSSTTCLKEVDELLAASATSGASLALARKFERLALEAMRGGDASLTVRLLRAAIIHHPDPKGYIEKLRSKEIPVVGGGGSSLL